MSTQATRLNVQGIDAVTPSNEDLNIFRILTTHLLRLLTLPWSIVSLAELPLNCSLAHPPNDWCKWRLHKVLPCHKCLLQLSNHVGPPFTTHTHTHTCTDKGTHTNRHTYTYTPASCNKMSCYATSQWLKVPFSLQMITLDSAQCSRNRILSDK